MSRRAVATAFCYGLPCGRREIDLATKDDVQQFLFEVRKYIESWMLRNIIDETDSVLELHLSMEEHGNTGTAPRK